ncbi:MAG: rlmB [Rickettsiales bacterium]|nr:rlmB [Rickettsiales bacterium]
MPKPFKPYYKTHKKQQNTPSTQHFSEEGNNSLWIYGKHAVMAALSNPNRTFLSLLVTLNSKSILEEYAAQATPPFSLPACLTVTDADTIDKRLPLDAVHQGMALQTTPLSQPSIESMIEENPDVSAPFLILDQVTDPHNIGAILRSAAAFGARAVIITKRHAPQETGIIAKTSSGALETIPLIAVTNLRDTLDYLKKHRYWCVGLDGEATQTMAEAKLRDHVALVLGAEGKGLRRLTAESCDLLVKLPISEVMESLNVSNAAAVALYELSRK